MSAALLVATPLTSTATGSGRLIHSALAAATPAPSAVPTASPSATATNVVVKLADKTHEATWLGLSADNWTTIAAGIGAALIAAIVAVIGYSIQQRAGRREQRATMYAQALQAVEDYCEGPYRIRRRDGSAACRLALTESLSDIKSRINFHQGWLSIHASDEIASAYKAFAKAAQDEAGVQMTAAWTGPATRKDRDVPLGVGLPRVKTDAAKDTVLKLMNADLTS